jgi:hypothetical protein
MRIIPAAFALGAAALSGQAGATVIDFSTIGSGGYTLFAGNLEESHFDFFGCSASSPRCPTSFDLAAGTASDVVTHGVELSHIGFDDLVGPPLSTSFDLATIFNIGGQSVTMRQNAFYRQVGQGSFQLQIAASDAETIDLGPVGMLDLMVTGLTIIVQPANDGDLIALRTTFLLESAGTPAVPEPATWAMMVCGFGMAGGAFRRRITLRTGLA